VALFLFRRIQLALARLHLDENQTTVRRELLAGLTTFMTMAYVVVVNPQILAEGGMPVDGVLFATCVSAAIATVIMGLWANYPIALALTSTVTSYIESAAGVAVCARTGLGNLVIAALFLVAMFCAPLVAAIPAYATAPALILVRSCVAPSHEFAGTISARLSQHSLRWSPRR